LRVNDLGVTLRLTCPFPGERLAFRRTPDSPTNSERKTEVNMASADEASATSMEMAAAEPGSADRLILAVKDIDAGREWEN
jgi:hypothetical protein